MEKVFYTLTRPPSASIDDFAAQVRGAVAGRLLDAGAHRVHANVADADVAPAAGLRIASTPGAADALVSVWVDSANDALRAPFDLAVSAVAAAWSAYLVTESVPLPEIAPSAPGERTPGMVQIAFLQRPAGLGTDDWLDVWLNDHTGIALATQDTFLYVQNVVTRVLTPQATPWHAIVEEGFPAAAMTDPHVFFDAVGDDERLARHQREMFASVQRFIDLTSIDVLPTSRYVRLPA